jgi:hypothetical protein
MIENGDEKVNGILLTNPSPEVVAAIEKTKEVAPEMGTTETVTEMGTEEAEPVVAETTANKDEALEPLNSKCIRWILPLKNKRKDYKEGEKDLEDMLIANMKHNERR